LAGRGFIARRLSRSPCRRALGSVQATYETAWSSRRRSGRAARALRPQWARDRRPSRSGGCDCRPSAGLQKSRKFQNSEAVTTTFTNYRKQIVAQLLV